MKQVLTRKEVKIEKERTLKMVVRLSSSYSNSYSIFMKFLLPILLLSLHISCELANSSSIVRFLPGFDGPLPFLLETGYVGVGENEDVQAFYYFIESENNPTVDPFMLWLTGGPDCSVLSGLMFEIGPLAFKFEEYNGSLPSLILRPQSWTKVSSILFVDMPVLTGFSYARTKSSGLRGDQLLVQQAHEFLRKWLIRHPKFLSNEIYIGGDSYSGMIIPAIVQEISQGNEKGFKPWINLQGYLLGNPVTTRREKNYDKSFAHGMGLISDELYESLQTNCKGEYIDVDPTNILCLRDIKSFRKAVKGIYYEYILDPVCKDTKQGTRRRSLTQKYPWKILSTHLKLSPISCRTYENVLIEYWANDDNVRKSLHIREGSIGKWIRCTKEIIPHTMDIPSSFEYHVNVSKKGYRSLIYSGDHDMMISFLSTQAWIRSLNYSIVDDWRQWYTNGEIAGYTRTYSNKMTFATVKGAGHIAVEYKPEECFEMFSRWLSNKAL